MDTTERLNNNIPAINSNQEKQSAPGSAGVEGCSRSLQSGQLLWQLHRRLWGEYLLGCIRASTMKPCPQGAHIPGDTEWTTSMGQRTKGQAVGSQWAEWPGPEEATLELCKALGQVTPAKGGRGQRPGGVPACCWRRKLWKSGEQWQGPRGSRGEADFVLTLF